VRILTVCILVALQQWTNAISRDEARNRSVVRVKQNILYCSPVRHAELMWVILRRKWLERTSIFVPMTFRNVHNKMADKTVIATRQEEKHLYLTTTSHTTRDTLTFRSPSTNFVRRRLLGSSDSSCHSSDATWQEIGRVCGSVFSCPRPGS